MKWILWSIWGVGCIICLLISAVIYVLANIIAFLWSFQISNLFDWGWFKGESVLTRDGETGWGYEWVPDKNPWETYKRWMFFLKE